METDPYEVHNLTGTGKYKTEIIKLRKMMDDRIKQTGSQFPEAKTWLPKNAS